MSGKRAYFNLNGGTVYEGFTWGDTHNGWAVPYFEKAVADKMLTDFNKDGKRATYNAATDTYTFVLDEMEEGEEITADHSQDTATGVPSQVGKRNLRLYSIGTRVWCWECDFTEADLKRHRMHPEPPPNFDQVWSVLADDLGKATRDQLRDALAAADLFPHLRFIRGNMTTTDRLAIDVPCWQEPSAVQVITEFEEENQF